MAQIHDHSTPPVASETSCGCQSIGIAEEVCPQPSRLLGCWLWAGIWFALACLDAGYSKSLWGQYPVIKFWFRIFRRIPAIVVESLKHTRGIAGNIGVLLAFAWQLATIVDPEWGDKISEFTHVPEWLRPIVLAGALIYLFMRAIYEDSMALENRLTANCDAIKRELDGRLADCGREKNLLAQELNDAHRQLDNQNARKAAIDRLGRLFDSGWLLRTSEVKSDEQLTVWAREAENWRQMTFLEISNVCSQADAKAIYTRPVMAGWRGGQFNQEHGHQIGRIELILDGVKGLIDRLSIPAAAIPLS